MEKKREKLFDVVYCVGGTGEIEKTTYGDYLNIYGMDETTTPIGVLPRYGVDKDGEGWFVYSWGTNGQNWRVVIRFDNQDDAIEHLASIRAMNAAENSDAPEVFFSEGDAIDYINEFIK